MPKLLIYKTLLDLWTVTLGHAEKSNTNRIQALQNNSLRLLSNAPHLLTHTDFNMKTIKEEPRIFYMLLQR